MKKISVFSFLFFLSLVSSAQFFHRKVNKFDKSGLRQGLWISYLDSDKKAIAGIEHFKDGKEIGVCRYYHPNGKLRLKFKFRNTDIKVKYFDEKRKLTSKGAAIMENTAREIHYYWVGQWKFYDQHHHIKSIAIYQKGSPPVVIKGEPQK